MVTGAGAFWQIRPNREELVRIALQAIHVYSLDRHYLVVDGKVQIIDEYTGRFMPDRNWEGGLHQMIEAKEDCRISGVQETVARITYQRFFRRYLHLAGMSGTAAEVGREMWQVYGVKPLRIPTNRPCQRKYQNGVVYATAMEKWVAIVGHVTALHRQSGRPILVGTRSVEASESLSRLLDEGSLPHALLNARQDKQEAEVIQQAGQLGRITIATNMAGRGTDIHLGTGVAEAGGLHVVLSECHDAGRIDRQLYGRCARQGDPGSCIAFTSLEDELMVIFRQQLPPILDKILPSSAAMPNWMRRLLLRFSQRSAERRHAAIRSETMRMDKKLDRLLSFTGKSM
jgi:preprotein translocase subunit SecA